ncbi:leucine zipper domain-containing protein [Conexibacter arvalis]|uniref:leucine zipper domain-containing protein n=1 Tax=Conexibacter arvalis TaxID=912552 RepID=UPI00160F1CB8
MVEEGWTLTSAAEAAEVSVRCARKWVGRYPISASSVIASACSASRCSRVRVYGIVVAS